VVETDDDPCDGIYRGTLPEGAACQASVECADIQGSEAVCVYDNVTLSGVCTRTIALARGRDGDECFTTCESNDCSIYGSPPDGTYTACYLEDGLFCSASLGTCVPPPALGEPCNDFYCAAGAYCSIANLTCQSQKQDGEICDSHAACIGGSCLDSLCGPERVASTALCSGQ
jgi:hypothetical protein